MTDRNQKLKPGVLKNDRFVFEYVVEGSGEPTIVFESGLGNDWRIWSPLIRELNSVTRTLAYNRAGYGRSSSRERDRNGDVIAAELHSLLHALNYKPPYILAGHSLGGAFVEIFAQQHPAEVCGLVLIDPMGAEMDELCRKNSISDWERPSLLGKIMASMFLPKGARQELKMREKTLSQTRVGPVCSNRFPVILLSAGKGMWSSRLQDAWLESHVLLAKRYADCCHVVEKDSGHHIQTDNPKFVAAQIVTRWFGRAAI